MLNGLKEVIRIDNAVTAKTICPNCKQETIFPVRLEELEAYSKGAKIQSAFKSLDPTHREMLLTGYCQPCWDKMFKEEDEK